MSKIPIITGNQLLAALKKAGFNVIRIKGSHHFLRHKDGKCTSVPIHSSEDIGPGLLTKILHDCEMKVDDLKKLIK